MAKVSSDIKTWLGSKYGTTQGKVAIGGKKEANKGGYLFLEAIDSNGAEQGGFFLFTEGTYLRGLAGVTEPSNTNTGGSSIVGGGVDTALSNIASVQIPNAGDLIPANANQVSVGNAAAYMSDIFFGGSLYCQTATFDTRLAFTTPAADRLYTFPDAGAAANVMLDTGAANVIAYTKGSSTIAMAANADLDIATGITVNIDNATTIQGNLTVSATCTLDQNLSTASAPGLQRE